MGAVFSTKFNIEFVSEDGKAQAIKVLKNYVDNELSYLQWTDTDTFEKLMELFMAANQDMFDSQVKTPLKHYYSSCFNASYGWGNILENVIGLIKPFVTKNSKLTYTIW